MKKSSTYLCRRLLINLFAWVPVCLSLFASSSSLAQQATLPCNATASTAFDNGPNGPFTGLTQSNSSPGVASWSSPGNVADGIAGNFATGNITLGGSVTISVKDPAHTYNAGNFAGFIVQPSTVVAAASLTIRTRLAGAERDTRTVPIFLLSTSAPFEAGLITTQTFDEIELTYTLVGITGSINVVNAVQRGYCTAGPTLACNTPTTPAGPVYPMIIDPANTGFSGLNVATISNEDNAISPSTTDAASVNLLVSAGSASFAIKDQLKDYSIGTFAGIDISNPGLVDVSALSGLTLSTYLNGVATGQSVSGASLLAVGSDLLSSSGRRTLGFISTTAFDEVKLTITGVAVTGITNIYGAVFETFCAGPSFDCAVTDPKLPKNTLTPVVNPNFPVYVDGANSGVNTVACVGCSLNNSNNAVDSDLSSAATLVLTGGVAVSGNFAVANVLDTYPANTYAGFDIESNTLLSANVLSTATITLLNNGSVVQTSTGTGLIVGATSSLLGTGTSRQTIGIVATVPFDEVKITFNQLVNADLGTIKIYNAVVQKNCSTPIVCNTAYNLSTPTFPVVIDAARTGVTGVVAASTTIRDPWNVVSASPTDFARITNTASVASNASIAVLDPVNTYPVGTFAGFSVRKVSGLVTADLFAALTVSTYNDGVLQETRTGNGGLLDLSIILFGATSDVANVGFVTTKPFDEIQLTVAPLVNLGVLNGNLDVFGAFVDTRTSTGGGLVCALNTNPDFAVTNKNVPATGSVKTNDIVPAGTTYGPAPTSTTQPAGASPSLTVNSDGTYTFVSATPGVYVYAVPVCGSGLSGTACATQTLTITVLDPTVNTNKPVANPDVVSTTGATSNPSSVIINVKANDGPGNAGGTLGTPTIATGPANGSATIDGSGNVVYKPNANFYGTDVLTYQVCETPGTNLCATTTVTITVKAPGSSNTTIAADDYVSTYQSLSATGNVKTNDSDPEGNTQTVTAQTTTIAGKGTLVVTSAGSYTFTPVAGATGPVDFTYTTTDNGSPSVSASGTLHVLINPFNLNPDFVVTNKTVPVTGSVKTNDVIPVGATYGPAPSPASAPTGSAPSLTVNSNGTFTFSSATPGVYVYNVPVCAPAPPTYCTTQTLTITVLDPAVTANPPVANPDFVTVTGDPTTPATTAINVKVNDGPGNPGGTLGTPTIATGPAHGTAGIDGNGNLTYTPAVGYYGTDVVTYQVCETPSNCATATVSITVKAPGAPANVSINDDYVSTAGVAPAAGNVLTNDLGNTLTVSNPATTVTSSGTLVLTATGSYTFTPAAGVTGPVDFTYTACDNSTPSVCGSATLHVLVGQSMPDLTPIIRLPQGNFGATGTDAIRDLTVEIREVTGQPTSSGNVVFTITAPFGYTIAYNNTITAISVTGGSPTPVPVDNTKWTVTSNSINTQLTLTINSGQFIAGNGTAVIGFTITRNSVTRGSFSNITVSVADDATKTYDSVPANNIFSRVLNAL